MSYCPSIADSEIARFRPGIDAETDDFEEPRSTLQFSARNVGNEKLSLLIVSTQSFCDRIKTVMSEIISEKYNDNIFIKMAEGIEQVLDSTLSHTTVDYIVLIIDASRKNNLKKLKNEIVQIESSYIAARRLCLVNGSSKNGIRGTDLEIAELAQQFNLLHLNALVTDDVSCKRLAVRILDLVVTSSGFSTGVPFIIPTAMDVFMQLFA